MMRRSENQIIVEIYLCIGRYYARLICSVLPVVQGSHPGVRGVFMPRQTRQLPRAVDLKGRLLSCQSY